MQILKAFADERYPAVQKFRSGEEMNRADVLTRPGEGFGRFIRHCARFRRFARRDHPRGVFRFRSLEEAQAARERLVEVGAASEPPAVPRS